ncbi:MAG: ABC transporter permease [Spirochaetales bacterium]|nr:ABC transporter permease [Spirochaetales bacterium]
MKKKSGNISKWLIPLAAGLAFVLIWQLAGGAGLVSPYILPPPLRVAASLAEDVPLLVQHAAVTFVTSVAGLAAAVALALLMCLAMDLWPAFKKAVYPYMVISQTIPIIFIYPVIMMGLGFGLAPKIAVVTLVCFFPIGVNLSDGLAQTDPELLLLFRSMKASRWKTILLLKLPGALPAFFSGLKIAAAYSVIGAVISEWLGAQAGLGVYMIRASKSFVLSRVFAGILVVVALSLGLFAVVLAAERVFLSWKFITNHKENKS